MLNAFTTNVSVKTEHWKAMNIKRGYTYTILDINLKTIGRELRENTSTYTHFLLSSKSNGNKFEIIW